jgi:hypothetical protein
MKYANGFSAYDIEDDLRRSARLNVKQMIVFCVTKGVFTQESVEVIVGDIMYDHKRNYKVRRRYLTAKFFIDKED